MEIKKRTFFLWALTFVFFFSVANSINGPAFGQTQDGCFAKGSPHSPLSGVLFSAGSGPLEIKNQVVVPACAAVTLSPQLSVRPEDVGKRATLLMYVFLPSTSQGYLFQRPVEALSSVQDFDLFGGPIDLSGATGLNAIFYYGYQLDDTGELVYNAYSFNVVAPILSDYQPPHGAGTIDGPAGGGGIGPWALRLRIARSSDGLSFTKKDTYLTDQADVSDLVVDDKGWVYAYYVGWTMGDETNKIGVAISFDDGEHWVYKYVNIDGAEGKIPPVDPDVVILQDGTFRLYVTYSSEEGAGPYTYYAEGTNGVDFQLKGKAFGDNGAMVFDPSVVKIGNTWHLYAWDLHGTSTDGTLFTPEKQLKLSTSDGHGVIISNVIPVSGGYRAYCYDPMTMQSIYSFFSRDGDNWSEEEGTRIDLEEGELESQMVKEAAVVRLKNGSYLMLYSTKIP